MGFRGPARGREVQTGIRQHEGLPQECALELAAMTRRSRKERPD